MAVIPPQDTITPLDPSNYQFINPEMAYELLTQLDIDSYVGDKALKTANYSKVTGWWELRKGVDYCKSHRALFVKDPQFIFGKPNFITNYWKNHKVYTYVIPTIGKDLTVRVDEGELHYVNEKQLAANIFFTFHLFHNLKQVGKQFSCLTQAYNHIPGHDKIIRKDMVGQALVEYNEGYKTRPECFNYERYFPKTWVLTNKTQCQDFFKEFNSPYYEKLREERNIVYFRKIGANVHEGKGVFTVNREEEILIKDWYKNGTLCGKVMKNNIIQYNVHNLLLVENRKFGFRSFLLVASTNPLIAYYHDGYARLSLNEYDFRSNDTSTFVTNIAVNKKNPLYANWTKLQIDDFTYWSLEKFSTYLYKTGRVKDPNWLNNYLRKEFMKVKIHLLRMSQNGFFKISSLFELYGLDFVMDENLDLWFIEANAMPLFNGFNEGSTELFNKMLMDTFEIITGLLKSRTKRIINYINELTTISGNRIDNIERKRNEFRSLTQNFFEPEFRPSKNNSFYPIVDENKYGTDRYFGLLEEKCLLVKETNAAKNLRG